MWNNLLKQRFKGDNVTKQTLPFDRIQGKKDLKPETCSVS